MSQLRDLGIIIGLNLKSDQLFSKIIPNIFEIKYNKPNEYMKICWELYIKSQFDKNNSLNGAIFEYILATLLLREELVPIYFKAKVTFVPNINYDILLYTSNHIPICLTLKVSIRERYKQADLEAIALKKVHHKSKNYLLSIDNKEVKNLKSKIEEGTIMGLDKVIDVFDDEFNEIIKSLKEYTYIDPPTVKVIESNHIITKEKLKEIKK